MIKNFDMEKKPIIFDIGANAGQSIERYNKIFENQLFMHSNLKKMKLIY